MKNTVDNTKNMFLMSFFGCFVLPIVVVFFATFSIFFDINFINEFYNWLVLQGGIWVISIYQILIILITVMLYLTLRLKDVEFITTEDVVKGKKTHKLVKKVKIINVTETSKRERKKVEVLDERDIFEDIESTPVKKIKKKKVKKKEEVNTQPEKTAVVQPVQTQPNVPKLTVNSKPKPMFSAIKRK